MAISFDEAFDPERKPAWLVDAESRIDAWLAATFCSGLMSEVKFRLRGYSEDKLSDNQLAPILAMYREQGWEVRYENDIGFYQDLYFKPYEPPVPRRRWWSLWLVKR
jgi:hypothetical protein